MTSQPLVERGIVRTDAELSALCSELREAGCFGLDTEFVGERTYVPRLCLVQVSTRGFIGLIDSLSISSMAPLWDLVADPDVRKVLHAAREDLRLAHYGGEQRPARNVFDTQVAAGLVGLPMYPLGYGRLVEALLQVRLNKGETRSEWDRRPLTPEQVEYARDDVRYLIPLMERLEIALDRLGRAEWMDEEMARFADPRVYEPDPRESYLRVRGARSGFSARPTGVLQALAAWREQEAAARNTPARMVIADEALIELALRSPRRVSDLVKIKAFPRGEEAHLGAPIVEAIVAAHALPVDSLPPPLAGGDRETPSQRALSDTLFGLAAAKCLELDIAPELVISKGDALAIAKQPLDSDVLEGWRAQAVGDDIKALAAGRISAAVRIEDGQTVVTFGPRDVVEGYSAG